ncbi:conserved membrane hypothetical protein [Methylocella tundrae]|uniref:Uncharacterized protein n=1 Tax=Methylocella tundrae TaxID=227605 RepID=A0A8B6M2X7_METTU|nr:hypothetical protein [Methylocella tundrae]VTZ48789.1 conserved membrane hypothetical protein [Methylocella tundrae]
MKLVLTEKKLRRRSVAKIKSVAALCLGVVALAGAGVTTALAQTIGAQLGTTAQEFSTAGGTLASTSMYVAALICFIAGAWYLWQSRQPENRESGKVAAGIAGLVLTGLFVTGGAWINKAANTTTGGNATITNQAGVVTFQ